MRYPNIYGLPYSNTRVTVELRDIVSGEHPVNIWDFEYDGFYQGDEKKTFEQKVIDHYYMRQIGFETVGRFLHEFRTRIREIMPYYKQLYSSIKLMEGIEDPFGNVDMTETFSQHTTDTRNGNSTTEGSTTQDQNGTTTFDGNVETSTERRHSDTPMTEITALDSYISDATKEGVSTDESRSETNTASASTSTNDTVTSQDTTVGEMTYTHTRKGNHGANTYAHDMIEYRQTFLNIDMLIIEDLADLFLRVY